MAFRVDSEIGRLRQVLVHRPDLEIQRLTPSNKDSLLFDEVLWAERAREEHDLFVQHLRDRGVVVHVVRGSASGDLTDPRSKGLHPRPGAG